MKGTVLKEKTALERAAAFGRKLAVSRAGRAALEALAELQQAPEEELGSRLAGLLKAVRGLAEMERAVWRNVF